MNELVLKLSSEEIILSRLDSIDSKLESIERNKSQDWSLLTTKQAALILQVSTRTLQTYRDQGDIPFIQFGREVRYRSEDIQQFLDDHYVKKGGVS